MKCIILAGGMQSTLANSGESIPKPMIEIGGKPLIWHIMKHFSEYGISEFIVCGGYKIDVIKEYFMDFYVYESDITVDLSNNSVTIHNNKTENWKVSVIDTGVDSDVIGRVFAVKDFAGEDFIVTYGDCISDVDVKALINMHYESKAVCTLMLTRSTGRKQFVQFGNDKPDYADTSYQTEAWISGDCYVLNSAIFDYPHMSQMNQVFNAVDADGKLALYKHTGYWNAVETMRDLVEAEGLWESNAQTWIKNR